ncbi:HNH endonuclease [Sphingomonas sp. IC-56]|uniref:HNH endonuclease n=1 Tax=Sphingomonas sp. IC-56 TaxID=2898529 RepID=UPI001E420C46|nr:HNH endonuclease [Sphingomonas sp. IC-56]MCD2323131.1 HNH endonuclease [Sphingomonas sp. IC-56]
MRGRVRRKAALAALEGVVEAASEARCALCERPLGRRVEWHHVVPKSEGGRKTLPVHPICHRTIHATVTNADLARLYPTMEALREREDIQRFLRWIADKPPDFHAPTRKSLER